MSEKLTAAELDENAVTAESDALTDEERAEEKEKKKNKARKSTVISTYFLALLCLLAGLLAPLFSYEKGSVLAECMMIRYIPSMVDNIINPILKRSLFDPSKLPWFNQIFHGGIFDSVIGVLYSVVTVVAVFMFIPVCLGKIGKSHGKYKNTPSVIALVIEVLALVVLTSYVAYHAYWLYNEVQNGGSLSWTDYNLLIAYGGTLLMAIVQSITTKGGIGVSKTIAVILSAVCIIALVDITLFIPQLSGGLNWLSNAVKSGDKANFVGGLADSDIGIYGLTSLFAIKAAFGTVKAQGALYIVLFVIWILVTLFTVVNIVVDIIGLGTGKKFKKNGEPCANAASNTFALVRYILTFVMAVAMIVFAIMLKDVTPGIYLYLLAIILFIQTINAIARTISDNSRVKKYQKAHPAEEAENTSEQVSFNDNLAAQPEELSAYIYTEPAPVMAQSIAETPVYSEPVYEEAPQFAEPVEEEPAFEEPEEDDGLPLDYTQPLEYTPVPEESIPVITETPAEPEVEKPVTSTVYVYGGDTDEFMETLTDAEKIEFVEIFIKKSKGNVNGVPDYVIGEDNSEFFPAVFIHINRYRNIVSDALMQKMYKQLGKVS